ncbi:MAG: sulfate adenylyltransferase subunit CysD [Planctomycetota bacterium]
MSYRLSYLRELEAEAIHVMREVVASCERPVMLYSVGKDSSCMLRLAQKAFYPGKLPFPLLHVDTTFKFEAMYAFRDRMAQALGAELIVATQRDGRRLGMNPFDFGTATCCSIWKTKGLLEGLAAGGYDAAFGGARRDEERSRAKERVFSFRDRAGQWDPKNQRPELWDLYNGRVNPGESIRVFPLSNWTEVDVWHYIHVEEIPVVPLYFAADRQVVVRGEQLIPVDDRLPSQPGDVVQTVRCRFRSLGCTPCTGAVRSDADTVPKILEELLEETTSERATRVIDHDRDGSMELKKREGYF